LEYRKLGNTNIEVSAICLGTMTFGEQNTIAEAHEQLDYAFERGINFIDTAEMYPVPPKADTYTKTEEFIGHWGKLKSYRDQIVLATKVIGGSDGFEYARGARKSLDQKNIHEAVNNSLKRLNTSYIDLYQLHWPDRSTNFFGQKSYTHDPNEKFTPIKETLEALKPLIEEGKIRHVGLSNETPWGVMKFLEIAKELDMQQVVSIQNPYNLLNRTFEIGLSEITHREEVGLLAYSPLAFGVLTGKYLGGQKPEGARLTRWERFSRYNSEIATSATSKYSDIAKKYGLNFAQMSLAFVNSRSFVTSNIIGATNLDQLKENIDSINLNLDAQVLEEIERVHQEISNPCP